LLYFLNRLAFALFALFCLNSCVLPVRRFEKSKKPKAPDYSNPKHWAALPSRKDSADLSLPLIGIFDNQSEAKADVFFVHPTSYRTGRTWNAKMTKRGPNKRTDKLSMRFQASVFNESCKVYAPRYRQAALITYIEKKGNAPKVFDFAYQDVRNAFLYYLKNYNEGRPFIIAGHSQGTDHALRLINEVLSDTIFSEQLIAAYLIGRPITKESVKILVPCDSARQTGCFVTWNATPWGNGTLFGEPVKGLLYTITWKRDTAYASSRLNLGSLSLKCKKDTALFDAKVSESGLIWVHRPEKISGKDYLYIKSESFHVVEYSLFYMNIRANIKQRVEEYLKKHP
jgi:hypothetical protein